MVPLLRRGDVVRIRDERWAVVRHVRHDGSSVVDVSGCDGTNRRVRTRFLLPFEPLERLPASHAVRVVRPRRWRRRARQALAGALPAWSSLRSLARARIDLLPFQLEPALAVVRGLAARVLIADAVGLGKTIQAGLIVAEILERNPEGHVLVVTPASLREQWQSELEMRFGLRASLVDSAALAQAGTVAGGNPWSIPLAITSIDYVKRPEVLRSLESLVWDAVVVDEAHALAGRSDRHTAAAAIGARARTVVLLTATPHSGDDDAFARLCRVGDVDAQFPLLAFRRTRDETGVASARRTVWLRVAPSDAEQAMHRALEAYARRVARQSRMLPAAMLAMTVLKKRACSSAASLGRSVERRIALLCSGAAANDDQLPLPLGFSLDDDDEPNAELAAPGLSDAGDERRTLARLLDLARRAAVYDRKLAAVKRFLRRVREPAIVFTEYRDTLVTLAAALGEFPTAQLHGGLSGAERAAVLRRFGTGAADVLLATDAASEGLNLQQRCRLVVNLELPWTPARLEQRVGRVDRIGQTRRVHQVHLVAAGTTEDVAIAPAIHRRGALVRDALGAMESGSGPSDTVVTVDLRDDAVSEAARAGMARSLDEGADHPATGRPLVTALHRQPTRAYWAFRRHFDEEAGEVLWEAMFGIHHRLPGSRLRHRADVRAVAKGAHDAIAGAAREHADAAGAALLSATHASVALAIQREQAIVRTIARCRARLAAALVQPELFGRRLERTAAALEEVLLDAQRGCTERLARLERRAQLAEQAPEPVFAVFLR